MLTPYVPAQVIFAIGTVTAVIALIAHFGSTSILLMVIERFQLYVFLAALTT